MDKSNLRITEGYVVGLIGDITRLHARYYHQHWGFDLHFEALVATDLVDFLQRYDTSHDRIWTVYDGAQVYASIIIDGSQAESVGARLRLFIISDALRGQGFGRQLMGKAIQFCDEKKFKRVYLSTFAGLDAARHLYEDFGFQLYKEHEDATWGKPVSEQHFERLIL